jgi:hypothetical protein
MIFRTARFQRAVRKRMSQPFAGCTFSQWRAISSRVATQTLGYDAT